MVQAIDYGHNVTFEQLAWLRGEEGKKRSTVLFSVVRDYRRAAGNTALTRESRQIFRTRARYAARHAIRALRQGL